MGVLDYNATPASNIAIGGIGIVSGSPVSNFDNALRQLMADIRAGITANSFVPASTFQPLNSGLTAIAALTTTAYGRSLLESASAAALFAAVKQDATTSATGVVELATDAEAQAGTDTARAITPANLQAVTATETRQGVVELATTAEAATGIDTARAVTAAGVRAAISSGNAALAAGAIGTYTFAYTTTVVTHGNTIAGSSLVLGGTHSSQNSNTGGNPSGTWRCMGDQGNGSGTYSVYLRIA